MLPRILAAVPQPALPILERVLGGHVSLVVVHRVEDASAKLRRERDLALVLCGVHFDESRMYDLLRFARENHPLIPFVACRVLDAGLSRISLEAINIAAGALGAAEFIDLPELIRELGPGNAEPVFRSRVLARLAVGPAAMRNG